MPNVFTDEVNNLVELAVDDHYEGSGVNDKTLGKMYYLKKYEKAAQEEYDRLRKEVELPADLSEKTVISNDKRFSAVAQPRQGSSKLVRDVLRAELIALFKELDGHKQQWGDQQSLRAAVAADDLLSRCTTYSKDTVAVTIIEDKRDA